MSRRSWTFPELGIEPGTLSTALELQDGTQRDVVHVFEQRLDVCG